MPMIKFPKGFTRRKSSGNALEELTNPPEPSFRVFERPGSKSFDGGTTLKRMSQGRPLSAGPHLDDNIFVDSRTSPNLNNRGSGGTNNSASSGGQNDNSSSSARYSSSSTLPSSTDVPLDDKPLPNPMELRKIPPEPHTLLRAAGRTFSFGRKKAPPLASSSPRFTPSPQNAPGYPSGKRERAMTESSYASGSTATPPKLLETDLDLGQSDLDGFGTMFESFGKRRSQGGSLAQETTTEIPGNQSSAGPTSPDSYFGDRATYTQSPVQVNASRQADSLPHSWKSHHPQDGANLSDGPTALQPATNLAGPPPVPRHSQPPLPSNTSMQNPNSPSARSKLQRPPSIMGAGLRRSSAYAPQRESYKWQDEDARLVMDSLSASRKLDRQSGGLVSYREKEGNSSASAAVESSALSNMPPNKMKSFQAVNTQDRQRALNPLFDSDDLEFQSSSRRLDSSETTPRAKQRDQVRQTERNLFDIPPPPSARFDGQQINPNTYRQNGQAKVMTPAQFERYRKEQEITRTKSNSSKSNSSDDENENYDDDDETERNRQLARQRRKQEAHLAVYRQQMMKMTGEQPSELPNQGQLRPTMDRAAMSTPDLSGRTSTPTFSLDKPPGGGKGSDDEDEDVPLGILAAHGFPSKNRPPSAVGNVGANPYIRYTSESYPAPPMSTAGTSVAGGVKGLPPFARNLPPDPYYGAGLVNPSNRESLAFGATGGSSVHGSHSPNLPPGGLVGVIAGEERARAMRRGSPNAQGNYGSPLPQGMPQMPMGVLPGMMPMQTMSAGEEAQVQMSQQMTQMMHMQMQWMQQMQQMVAGGMQGPQPGLTPQFLSPQQQQMAMTNGFLSPPGQMSRPTSMGSHSAGASALAQNGSKRPMSMMGPGISSPWPSNEGVRLTMPGMMSGAQDNPGYTPSIAPSERSNLGMPSRYRPVSIAPNDEAPRSSSRASTFTSNALLLGSDGRSGFLSTKTPVQSTLKKTVAASDDDEEEGWEEMKQNRERKKFSWRSKKKEEPDATDIYYSEL
ncbi:hypothetical protein MMC07_006028 [Pseudocyphellaria aurata]|nr:hypothetical protein [Pseudocyphellaria aurata]